MPYLLGDLDDRQTYHPRKLREGNFSGTTYDTRTGQLTRAEFAIGLPKIPKLGGLGLGRGVRGLGRRVRMGIGRAARTGVGRGIGRVAARAAGLVGGRGAMRGVGNVFRSARRFSGHYLLSDLAEFRRDPRLARFSR